MSHEVVWNGVGGLDGCNIVPCAGIGRTVVNDGTSKGGDVIIIQGDIPHHDFVDHALKVSIPSPIYAQLVEVNVVERAVGIDVCVHQNAVHVLPNIAVIKDGH